MRFLCWLMVPVIMANAAADDSTGAIREVVVADTAVTLLPLGEGTFAYVCGEQKVDTPLPVGYPRPTAPGAIEVKYYPAVRRATIAGQGTGYDGMFGRASGQAFWPLFMHIQSRDIAMTAPVEMNVEAEESQPTSWSMSFLYREPANGPLEKNGNVEVVDEPAITVWSQGATGELSPEVVEKAVADLTARIAESPDWEISGPPRTLAYNGPDVPTDKRWIEVQVPVASKRHN